MTGVEAAAISAVVSGTLKIVVNKLAPLLIKEYSSIVGVKEDLQELHDLVAEINFWLETTTDNSVGSKQSFSWLKKLKDISYDVDDVVDEFQLKAEKHDSNSDGGIVSSYLCTIPKSFVFQCKAANKIKAIKKRFAAIVKQRTEYIAIKNSLSVDPPVRHTNMKTKEVLSLSNVDEELVVGRDKDKQKIISMLEANDDLQKIKIVSVIGLGGSGKTTLAKLVFNDGNIIEKHFEVRLWVHVSQEFDVKDLIKKVFEAFSENNPGPQDRVAACLRLSYFHLPSNLKQCFTICSVFPKGHEIDKQQLIDLWIAHDMIILENGIGYLDVGHKNFNSLVQASFLQNVKEEDGRVTCWMHDLVHDLALSILGDEISLDMPNEASSSTTKSCRYFSLIKRTEHMAPKNIFRKARAVYMPKYEDYIYAMSLKHAKHLRSVTVGYLNAEGANAISQVKYLKYLAVSQLHCETLPATISDIWSLQALHVKQSYSLVEIPKSICKMRMLRTLNLSRCIKLKSLPDSIGDCHMISNIDLRSCSRLTVLPDSIAKLQKLRKLNLSRCRELKCLPDSIGRNKMLRSLRLVATKVQRLPSSMTKLENLECLDLHECSSLVELPEGIGNLDKLQVLNLTSCTKLGGMPVGIGQLSRLQKLGLFAIGKGEKFAGMSELANISRLGEKLTIIGIQHVMDTNDAHVRCLKQKINLQRLKLKWMSDNMEEVNTELQQDVLDGLEPPPGIKELYISGYLGRQFAGWVQSQVGGGVQGAAPFPFLRVMWLCDLLNLKHLDGLVELPCLEELYLLRMPSLESISGGPFPSLVKLWMHELPHLGGVWMIPERTMPDVEDGGGCYNYNLTPHLGQL